MKKLAALAITTFVATHFAIGADWPRFRGPNGTGVVPDGDLPVEWSKTSGIAWKRSLPGRGLSNPVIAKGRIFLTAASGWQQRRLHVLCFEESTGDLLWERQFWATGTSLSHPKTNMAAPTPVTDGDRVFALFATFDLVGLDRDGNLLWFRSLTTDYPTVGNNVGMASSPTLHGDTVFLAVENAGESFALAVDAKTGENRWRTPRRRGINWVTPTLGKFDAKWQVIFQSPDEISAHDPSTGKKLWRLSGPGYAKIPSPTCVDGRIYTQGPRFQVLRPSQEGAEPEVIWESRKIQCGYSSPLIYRNRVFGLTFRGVLRCADALTGKILWTQRLEGEFAASLVGGAGKIYATNEEGTTTVIDVTGDRPKIVAVNRLEDKILATPALANGAIYLRSDHALYCIRKKRP